MYIMTTTGWKIIGGPLRGVPAVKPWWRGSYPHLRRPNPDHPKAIDRMIDRFDAITGSTIE